MSKQKADLLQMVEQFEIGELEERLEFYNWDLPGDEIPEHGEGFYAEVYYSW